MHEHMRDLCTISARETCVRVLHPYTQARGMDRETERAHKNGEEKDKDRVVKQNSLIYAYVRHCYN